VITVDEQLDILHTQEDSCGIDFEQLKLKLDHLDIDLLGSSLSILNGIPRDQLQGALKISVKEFVQMSGSKKCTWR